MITMRWRPSTTLSAPGIPTGFQPPMSDWGPAARMGLGDALREHGDLDGAQAAYQQAIDSGHAEWAPAAMVRLGALLGDEGHDGSQLDTGGARSNAPTAA